MIVLDSSFLIGFHNFDDSHHSKAFLLMRRFLDGEWGKGLLLEYETAKIFTGQQKPKLSFTDSAIITMACGGRPVCC